MAAPIAIFAFNRADKLEAMLTSLRQCHGVEAAEVTIFIDGPRTAEDEEGVQATRATAERLAGPKWTIAPRAENMGLRRSISRGVTEICANHGRAIVLEDDLILSPIALDYFNSGLEKYADRHSVWSVSAYMYDAPQLLPRDSAFFLPFAHPWGWATWDRAWRQFDPELRPCSSDLSSRAFKQAFNLHGLRNFSAMLDMADKGLVNSWFIRWYYAIFSARAVSVFPPQTFVTNTGISDGTHASALNPHGLLDKCRGLATTIPEFPDDISVDYSALDSINASSDARIQRITSELGRVKRHAKKLLSQK